MNDKIPFLRTEGAVVIMRVEDFEAMKLAAATQLADSEAIRRSLMEDLRRQGERLAKLEGAVNRIAETGHTISEAAAILRGAQPDAASTSVLRCHLCHADDIHRIHCLYSGQRVVEGDDKPIFSQLRDSEVPK